jgi:alpha-L-rhamnosidase
MLGHAEAWFYQGLAGIRSDPAAPGFRHFILRPEVYPELKRAGAQHRSIAGLIYSGWEVEGGTMTWRVLIPPNTSATAYIPRRSGVVRDERGALVTRAAEETDGYMSVELSAGSYEFVSTGW